MSDRVCIESAVGWAKLARREHKELLRDGHSVFRYRQKLYMRTAESLIAESKTGVAHCSCHLLPYADCRRLRRK